MTVIRIKESLSILFFLIFPNLIFGPAIPDILISLIGLIGLIYIFLKKEFQFFKNNLLYLFGVWYLFLLISSFWSIDPLYSLESSLFYFRFFIFSLIVIYLINETDTIKNKLFLILSLTFVFIIITSLWQFFITDYQIPFFAQKEFHQENDTFHQRLQGPFFQSILGGYLIKFIPLLFVSFFMSKNFKNKKIIFYLIVLFSFFIIFLTGERSSFVLVIIFILFLFMNKTISNKLKLIFFPTIAFLYFLAFYFLPSLIFRILFTMKQFNILGQENIMMSNIYFKYFYNAYLIFLDNILIGSGPKMFRNLCAENLEIVPNSCSTHPHNMYAQLLSETGIIGFLFILFIFLFFLYKLLTIKTNDTLLYNIKFFSFVGLLLYLWPLNTSNSFFNNYANIILFIYIAFSINALREKK